MNEQEKVHPDRPETLVEIFESAIAKAYSSPLSKEEKIEKAHQFFVLQGKTLDPSCLVGAKMSNSTEKIEGQKSVELLVLRFFDI